MDSQMPMSAPQVTLTTARGTALLVYTVAGLPLAFFYYGLPAYLSRLGHDDSAVSATALVFLPLALRGAWAPLIDKIGGGDPGRYLIQLIVYLLLMVALTLGLAFLDPAGSIVPIIGIGLLVFFLGSSAMTAFAGFILPRLDTAARSRLSVEQSLGVAVSGTLVGSGLFFLDGLDWRILVIALTAMAGLFVLAVIVSLAGKLSGESRRGYESVSSPEKLGSLFRFLGSREARYSLAVSVTLHGAFGLVLGYLPILQVRSGMSMGEIGLFGAVGTNLIGVLSTLLAGYILVKIRGWSLLLQLGIGTGLFMVLSAAFYTLSEDVTAVILFGSILFFLSYFYFVPFKAIVLTFCQGRWAASQAALLSSCDLIVGTLFAAMAGLVTTHLGLQGLFSIAAFLAAVSVLTAWRAPSGVVSATKTAPSAVSPPH